MDKLYLFARNISSAKVKTNLLGGSTCLKKVHFAKSTFTSTNNVNTSSSSSDSGSSDSESDVDSLKSIKSEPNKKEEALNKLNILLKQIVEEEVVKSGIVSNFARPANKRIKKESQPELQENGSVEKKIVSAVKDVAKEIGGDAKHTESELLLKLLSPVESSTESATNLSDIIKGMKIDRETKSVKVSRAEQVRSLLQQVKSKTKVAADTTIEKRPRKPVPQRLTPNIAVDKINLFGSKPLGIFSNKDMRESTENKTWQALYERDLKLAVTHPPSNYFQQMILWTEQGKLWKFPIDNEQDLEEEKKVYFTEHIFLEDYLEPWCPPKGPIRHFMELVCVGLSKNSYLTVEAKKEHIDWYKNYFEEKRKILEEVGAIPAAADKAQTQKTLE